MGKVLGIAGSAAELMESTIQLVPLGLLTVSPREARKTLDQAALKELAASIALKGVQEPLLVRPIGRGSELEIVAGQRRFEASKIAGKKSAPCIVREMTDEEAAEAALTSNLQREDLPPLEEALGFQQLLDRPGATIESVAAALGKSASHVGRRLKLVDAIEPVREALRLGAIEVGHALELARLSRRQQEQLLEWLNVGYSAPDEDGDEAEGDDDEDGAGVGESGTCRSCGDSEEDLGRDGRTWMNEERTLCSEADCVSDARREKVLQGMSPTRKTVAHLRSHVLRTQLRVLRDVPFPLDDEIPPMACTACPKRASGPMSLFSDVAEDTCTDPECLDTKLKVWVKAQLEAAERAGRKLAMLYGGHARDKAGVSRWNCVIGADCPSQEPAIWIDGARIGHLVQICRDSKCPEHGAKGLNSASGSASGTKGGAAKPAAEKKQSAEEKRRAEAEKAERAKLAEKVRKENEYRERLYAAIASTKDFSHEAANQITRSACLNVLTQAGQQSELAKALGWPIEDFAYGKSEVLAERLRKLDVGPCLHAAALALSVGDVSTTEYALSKGMKPERMERVAGWLGVDVKAMREGKAAGAKPAPAKKAPVKKAAAKKKLPKKLVLSPADRKRIADAQKKRWSAAKKGGRK